MTITEFVCDIEGTTLWLLVILVGQWEASLRSDLWNQILAQYTVDIYGVYTDMQLFNGQVDFTHY